MKLTDIFSRKAAIVHLKATERNEVIKELVQTVKKVYALDHVQVNETVKSVLAREKLGSTGLGGGIAIPHAKIAKISGVIGGIGVSAHGIDFSAVDGESVHVVFCILSPQESPDAHVQALRKIMWAIKQPNFCKFVRNAKNAKQIEEILKDVEEGVQSAGNAKS